MHLLPGAVVTPAAAAAAALPAVCLLLLLLVVRFMLLPAVNGDGAWDHLAYSTDHPRVLLPAGWFCCCVLLLPAPGPLPLVALLLVGAPSGGGTKACSVGSLAGSGCCGI
jgi:hypothetical protein